MAQHHQGELGNQGTRSNMNETNVLGAQRHITLLSREGECRTSGVGHGSAPSLEERERSSAD
eukprot:1616929-Rhodomonas_salina.1